MSLDYFSDPADVLQSLPMPLKPGKFVPFLINVQSII